MKVLITGATGFVGQNLVPTLIEKVAGIEILTLNRDIEKASSFFPYDRCRHVGLDAWNEVISFNPSLVLHLATFSTADNSTSVIQPLIQSNIEYGVFLLNALRECKDLKLFVNTGSFAEYLLGPQELNSAYLYTATKTAFRSFVDYYSQLGKFSYINVIPYSVYGGKMTVKRLIDYMIDAIDSSVPVAMTEGEQILDFIHVQDVVDFYVEISKNIVFFQSAMNKQEIHLGTGKGTSIKELASIVETVYQKKCNIDWGKRPYRNRETMFAVAPIAKNLALLNWKAKISITEGILKMKS